MSVCETLIEFEADVHGVDREGKTPLHMASMRGSGVLVRLLLKHGADANVKDKKDLTPADVVKSDSGAESVFGNARKYRGSIYGPPTVNTEKTAWVHQIDEIETPPPPPPPVPSPEKSTVLTIQENEKQEDEAPPSPPTPIYHHPVRPRKHDISRFEMRKRAEKLRNQNERLLTAFTNLISSSSSTMATTITTAPKQRTSALISRSNLESRRSEVALWLKRLRMDRYINTFLLSGFVSLPLVATITKMNLKDMGIAKAHIEKVLGPAIKNLASSQAIMHERARNACDMEYNTRGDDRLVAVRESKTSSTCEYIYVRENERYSPETNDWGRAYPKMSNLKSTDPPRWCDETGT